MVKRVLVAGMCLTFLFAARAGWAGVPHCVSVQGVLTDASEQPIDGTRSMTFRIYDVSSGGTALWTETQSVSIDGGRYSVLLGSVAPLDLPFDKDCWLSVEVESDSEMTPRYRIASSPYAYNSEAVNAIPASAAPQADALLALDASGKFPTSVLDTGAGPDQVVALDGSGKLPAVDGSQVTNVQAVGVVPVGAVVAWMKSMFGTPALPSGFVECNGQTLSDAGSPYDGQVIPNLNGASRFLRGSATSGATGGSESHVHRWAMGSTAIGGSYISMMGHVSRSTRTWQSNGTTIMQPTFQTEDSWTEKMSHLPPYFEVVWIMRVK